MSSEDERYSKRVNMYRYMLSHTNVDLIPIVIPFDLFLGHPAVPLE